MILKKTLFCLFVSSILVFAQSNILSNGNLEYGDGGWYVWNNPNDLSEISQKLGEMGIGVDKSQGAMVSVKKKPKTWWSLQLQPPKFLADSTFYTLKFKAKITNGKGPIVAIVQGGPPDYRQKESVSYELTPHWKEYTMTFLADEKGYGLNNIAFQLGYITGDVYVDDVEVVKAENIDDMSWYNTAEVRIDSLRKKELSFKTKPNVDVQVELVHHDFPFGTALALYNTKDSVEKWYREMAKKYFWYGVPENQFKWPEYEPKKGKIRRGEFKEYLDFVKENHWGFRAHTLIWGHQGYGYDKHFGNLGSCKEITDKIRTRITRDVKEYKGIIKEYDVWNEVFHESYLFDKCGWSLLDSAFIWAHQADPDAKLFINEYNVVSAGETDRLYEIVKGLLERKVPIHGIGVQCHFNARPVVPGLVKARLDKLGSLGLPIKVTELDFGTWEKGMDFSEEEQANRYEMFLRSAFSHSAVEGILLWGFWDGRHWIKNGGIIALDGREKLAAKRIKKLWREIWTTKGTFKSSEEGIVHLRGFPGRYKITVEGKTFEKELR